jgi:hypothetical protein
MASAGRLTGMDALMNLAAVALLLAAYAQDPAPAQRTVADPDLHPSLVVKQEEVLRLWDLGFKEAAKKRDADFIFGRLRRGIGSIQTSPLGGRETVSFLWLWHITDLAYLEGFEAKKKYLPEDQIADRKKVITHPDVTTNPDGLVVTGLITLMPSFGGARGRINRHADPSDFDDVRVVMKVGERVYQPVKQPGTLPQQARAGSNEISIPRSTTTVGTATATGPGGWATATGTATTYYRENRRQGYSWYQGHFQAIFPLYDQDGKPTVRKDDKELTIIVIYGPNERKATYKLDELPLKAK